VDRRIPEALSVHALLAEVEIDPERVDLLEEAEEVGERPSEPVDRPAHDHVELPTARVATEGVELRSLIPTLGASRLCSEHA
jgi:hypothetical protein